MIDGVRSLLHRRVRSMVYAAIAAMSVLLPPAAADEITILPPAFTPAPQEATSLGMPRDSFDASGISDGSAEQQSETALSRFDPRKSDIAQVIGAMSVVIGLLVVMRMVFLRASRSLGGAGRPSGVVEILARYPVARGQQLILLKLARRVLLIHQNGTAMTTLSEMSDADEVAALLSRVEAGTSNHSSKSFKRIFSKFASDHDAVASEPFNAARASNEQGEVIDLTKRPGGIRTLLSAKGTTR
jgi:flagellar biogenesis protein FliO